MVILPILFFFLSLFFLVVSFYSINIITNAVYHNLLTSAHKVSILDVKIFFYYLSFFSIIMCYKLITYSRNHFIKCYKWHYKKELDGVRALAAISIILFHYQPYGNFYESSFSINNLNLDKGLFDLLNNLLIYIFQFGFNAVGVFIILSGLSLSMNYYGNADIKSMSYWKSFYFKRMLRILPLYWSVLIISYMLAYFYGKKVTFQGFFASFFLVQNYYLPWYKELGLVNQPLWFIPLLIVLYILFPILIWLKNVLGDTLYLLLLIGFSVTYFNTFVWILPLGRLGEFGLGIVLGNYLLKEPNINLKLLSNLLLCILFILLFALFVYLSTKGLQYSLIQPILPIFLFFIFLNISFIMLKYNLIYKICFWLATGSYAAYLIHPLLLRLIPNSFTLYKKSLLFGLAFLVIVFLLSFLIISLESFIKRKINIRILINKTPDIDYIKGINE